MSIYNMLEGRPGSSDPYFPYVSLLLPGTGTNGAQNNTFLDSSSNAFTITRNGNTTQGAFGAYGSNWSNYFNGSSTYLTIPDNTALDLEASDFCLEAFIFMPSTTVLYGMRIFSKYTYSGRDIGYFFDVNNNTYPAIRFYAYNSSGVAVIGFSSTSSALVANTWNHVAVCRSGSNAGLFVNGTRVASSTTISGTIENTTQQFCIGSENGLSTTMFTGYISNARVVKGSSVYDPTATTLVVPNAPLTAIANTSLLTCQSNRFIDNSSNAFTITANGSPTVSHFNPFNLPAPYSTGTNGASGYLDGSGDYLTVANNAAFQFGTGDFTVEYWAYFNETLGSGGRFPVSCWSSNSGYELYYRGATPNQGLAWYYNSAALYSNTVPTQFQWNHIAASRSSGTTRLFLNGAVVATLASDTSNLSPTDTFYIGVEGGSTGPFLGYLSDLRVVKGVAVYTGAFTPPTLPLATSGAASAASYPSTTNVNTTFASSSCSLLCSFANGGVIDNSTLNDLETVSTAQISTAQSKFGNGSILFNGSTDYLKIAYQQFPYLAGNNFTIEGFFYFNASVSGTGYNFLMQGANAFTSNAGFAFLRHSSNKLRFIYTDDGSGTSGYKICDSTNTFLPNTGQWYHLAVTRSGNTFTLWIDGVSSGTATLTTSIYQSTLNVTVGADSNGAGLFNGYMSNLRVTNGYARYSSNFTAPTAPFPTS